MSSEQAATQTAAQRREAATEPFRYATTEEETNVARGAGATAWTEQNTVLRSAAEQREREAFTRGIAEGELRARTELSTDAEVLRAGMSAALEGFKAERVNYFARIEPEVVQLSLAISRKILHRESQVDPLLLTGMVHVALEKLDRGTHIRLRAHPDDMHYWTEHFANAADCHPAPELVGDPQLKRGECALETEMGNTLISLETHLKEIEQGFLDLLEQRPRVR
jgi:flagellar assembly protein FliH